MNDHEMLLPSPAQGGLRIPHSSGPTLCEATTERWALTVNEGTEAILTEVLALRKKVYVDEWRIMNAHELPSPNDTHGVHVLLRDRITGELVGCTHMMEADHSDFVAQTGLAPSALSTSVLSSRSTVARDHRKKGVFQLLVYAASQWYRRKGKKFLVSYIQEGDHPTHTRFRLRPIPGARDHVVKIVNGTDVRLKPYAETLEYIMHRGTQDVAPELMELIAQLAPQEIEYRVSKMAERINQSALWRRAADGTLTSFQYADLLSQLHHFVRFTTRVIARALSHSEDKVLRAHFRKHMVEETDHELIIESDLENLGMDVDYFVRHKVAHPGIFNFNGLQESLLGYRHDPVLYMAVPFAVEGLSAFISESNMNLLYAAARSWGIENPKLVTAFLASHRHFDGGEGGHWEMTLDMIRRYVRTENQTKQFLSIAQATTDNILTMFEETLDGNDWTRWHLTPSTLAGTVLH